MPAEFEGYTIRTSGIVVPESNASKGKAELTAAFAMTIEVLVDGFKRAFPTASDEDAQSAAGQALLGPIASQTFIEILSRKLV